MSISNLLSPAPRWAPSRDMIIDSAMIGVVALLLMGIHFFVPSGIQNRMAFDYGRFNLWGPFTAAYVHADNQHLFTNIIGLFLTAGFASQLSRNLHERRWFQLSTGVFLIVLPILVSSTSYMITSHLNPDAAPVSRGFSSIVAGYVGLCFAGLLIHVKRRYSISSAQYLGQAVLILMMFELALIYGAGADLAVIGATLLGLVVSAGGLLLSGAWPTSASAQREVAIDAGIVCLVTMVIGLFVLMLFPVQVVSGNSATNILAHALGIVYGALLAGAIFVLK